MKFDLSSILHANHWAKQLIESTVSRALNVLADRDRTQRLEQRLCASCFYLKRGQLVGHAFTNWKCLACEKEQSHPNTGVPKLCDDCTWKYNACASCCADLDLRDRKSIIRLGSPKKPRPKKEKTPG
jgi:hypothetical protein